MGDIGHWCCCVPQEIKTRSEGWRKKVILKEEPVYCEANINRN
jgi:hypothetical protein